MKTVKNIVLERLFLASVFAGYYTMVEVAFDTTSHFSMSILGGLCGFLIGNANEIIPWKMPLLLQGVIGGTIITVMELITGYIVNIQLGLNVWDYSGLPLSFCSGQINLFFSIIWCIFSVLIVVYDDYLKYWLFDEEKPHYRLF